MTLGEPLLKTRNEYGAAKFSFYSHPWLMRPIWPGTTSLPVQVLGTFLDKSLVLPA